MPNSRSIELYYSSGDSADKPQHVEVTEPDDDGDIRVEMFEGIRSTGLAYGAPSCIRELAIALLKAAG